jgi:hypothetical protein
MRSGVAHMAMTMPRYWASAVMPTAVARSWIGNHSAASLVTEFKRSGWATARPTVAATTRG